MWRGDGDKHHYAEEDGKWDKEGGNGGKYYDIRVWFGYDGIFRYC
jgi:hypothetical protein